MFGGWSMPAYFFRSEPGAAARGTRRERAGLPAGSDDREPARGDGPNFAAVLVREVLYRSFANRRQLASYVGIAPMPYQSGGMDRDRNISGAGNPRARTTLIQLAWLWLRYQPGSALATWFRERVGMLQGPHGGSPLWQWRGSC